MFCLQDFEVDETSAEYLALHPVASMKKPSLIDEHFEAVMEDEDSPSDSDASTASHSSEDDHTNDKRKSKKRSGVLRLMFIHWFIQCFFLFCVCVWKS